MDLYILASQIIEQHNMELKEIRRCSDSKILVLFKNDTNVLRLYCYEGELIKVEIL